MGCGLCAFDSLKQATSGEPWLVRNGKWVVVGGLAVVALVALAAWIRSRR